MNANRNLLMRAMVLAAKRSLGDNPAPGALATALEAVATRRFSSEVQNGVTLVSTNDAGGGATFTVAADLGAADLMTLAMEALSWLQMQADPDNPPLYPKTIKRLRVSFAQAEVS